MSTNSLFISPHPDDIAFSIGGIVRECKFAGTLFTVFGASEYAPTMQGERSALDITRMREAEDRNYASAVGLSLCSAFLPAASSRLGIRNTMTSDRSPYRIGDEDSERMLEGIRRAAPGSAPVVFLPAALMGHRDHVICREFVRHEERYNSSVKIFYEDLPYALSLSEAEICKHMAEIDNELQPIRIIIEDALPQKCIDVARYASQVDAVLTCKLREAAVRSGVASERVWVIKNQWREAQEVLAR